MSYLKQTHTQILWLLFVASSILLVAFPVIDIQIAHLFYQDGFYLKDSFWVWGLYKSVTPFISISFLMVIAFWLINKYTAKTILSIKGRHSLFVFLVLLIGAGLIVNVSFKDQFGRARPRDIIEFGGVKHFSSAFVISDQCGKNSSFSSGHGAGAFFALALAMLFKNRKKALAIAMIYGIAVSLARMAAGGHFFSDNLVSFFVMAITTDGLYYLLFVRNNDITHTAET